MYKKILITGIVIAIVVFALTRLISYMKLLELNTVDPQSSGSIKESRENGFYLADYKLAPADLQKGITLTAWVEQVWKNVLVKGERKMEKLEGLQLVMKTNSLQKSGFVDSTFLINWEIEVKDIQLPGIRGGSGNGAYINFLNSKVPPDSIRIVVGSIAAAGSGIYKPLDLLLLKQ